MIENISVDLNKLYANKLKLEEYFILFCLVHNEEELLVKYTTNCGGIDTNVFQKLRNSSFIILTNEINITFNSIKVTDQTKNLFNVSNNLEFDLLFRELLSTYPNSVKRMTGGTRRLHNDLVRCKILYKKTIITGISVSPIGNVNKFQLLLLSITNSGTITSWQPKK